MFKDSFGARNAFMGILTVSFPSVLVIKNLAVDPEFNLTRYKKNAIYSTNT
jgi:hypothetical protein